MLAAITAFLIVTPGSTVEAETSFDVTVDIDYCNALNPATMIDPELDGDPNCTDSRNTGAAQTTTTTFCVPGPGAVAPCSTGPQNANFSGIVTFYPPETVISAGTAIPVGDKVGGLFNTATLGLINGACSNAIPIPFVLFNVALPNNPSDPRSSTNIYTPYVEGTSTKDILDLDGDGSTDLTIVRGRQEKGQLEDATLDLNQDGDGDIALPTSEAIQNYPDWLLDLFDPDWMPTFPAQDGPRTEIIDGLVDVDGDTVVENPDDYGTLDGYSILAGKVDIDGDGRIKTDGTDDGTIAVPFLGVRNVDDGVIDISGANGAGDPADDYSDNRQNPNDGILKPIVPLAVYGSLTAPEPASDDWIPLYFVLFNPGDLQGAGWDSEHPFESFGPELGYPSITVLTDITEVAADISAISDFCSPLLSQTMLQGVTGQCGNAHDDDSDGGDGAGPLGTNDGCPAFGGAETAGAQCDNQLDDDGDGVVNDGCAVDGTAETGGTVRAKNPATADTYKVRTFAASIRDLDNDGYENSYDTCPLNADTGDDDGDGINDSCDPTPGVNTAGGPTMCPGQFIAQMQPSDHDGDCFLNRQDNAPLAANGRPSENAAWDGQKESENSVSYPSAVADSGPKTDAIGDVADTGSATFAQNNFNLLQTDCDSLVPIVSSSVADPTVITTSVAHGKSTGDGVVINDHVGSTPAIFGDYTVTVLTATTFTIPVNVTTGGTGGTITPSTGGPNDPDCTTVNLSTTVANGHYLAKGLVNPVCIGGTDNDDDGWCVNVGAITDPDDGDPNFFGPVGDPPPDLDGDTYDVWMETWLGTDDTKACAATGVISHGAGYDEDEPVDYFPGDMNDDQVVNLSDVLYMAPPVFFSVRGSGNYVQRVDLNGDGVVNLGDVLYLAPPVFFSTCTPVAQQ